MPAIEHIFVLMLENRSFDHMLGFSPITGTDATTGGPTQIDGLLGTESNSYQGKTYTVSPSAPFTIATDPGHEFPDVVTQLAGPTGVFPHGGPYPPVDCSGFAASFAADGSPDPGTVLRCFHPATLPDNPRIRLPERNNIRPAHQQGLPYRLYGPRFPITGALKGISPFEVRPYSHLATDLADPGYPAVYTVIEPDYGDVLNHYIGGTSQHPLDDVRGGEKIIKTTYETLRFSPVWNTSMLILTWDEHGGFYDHTHPPTAPTPADAASTHYNTTQFDFTIYGVRVPAVVISPLIPPQLIDHRTYDHTSILATVEHAFGIEPLTARDATARSLLDLATLPHARTDAPTTLPDPAGPTLATPPARSASPPATTQPGSSADRGNLPGFLHVALRQDLAVTPTEHHRERLARISAINTQDQAKDYLREVHQRVTNNPHLTK